MMVLNRLKKSFDKEISSYLDLNIIFCDLAAIGCPGFVVEYKMYGIFMYLILIRIFGICINIPVYPLTLYGFN